MATSFAELSLAAPLAFPALPYSRPGSPGIPTQVGFVGLGTMGYPMAHNLAAHKHKHSHHHSAPLLVWNRSADRSVKLLREVGATKVRVAESLAELALECDIIFTSLATDEIVKSVFEEMIYATKIEIDDSCLSTPWRSVVQVQELVFTLS